MGFEDIEKLRKNREIKTTHNNGYSALRTRHSRDLYAMLKKPTAQIAHLVFADTKANAEKPKELFFANAD